MKLYLYASWVAMAAAQTAPVPETSASVEGQVIFAATGEAVAKAHVSLISDRADLELLATTDAAV